MIGVPVTGLAPGSPAWAAKMSASKIAAVIGVSPFESRFSLWHKMAGNLDWDVDNDTLRRGHYLEPALRQWFRDQHPDLTVARCSTYAHPDRPWQIASPDALVAPMGTEWTATLECKTANNDWEWGEEGTDQVPPYYRAQAMWQMDTLGLARCHFSVLTSFMDFREYYVDYDPDEALRLREAALAFLDSIARGEAPELDGNDRTYQAVRQLHPAIDDVDAEIDTNLAVRYVNALVAYELAEADKKAATVEVAAAMGTARRAVHTLDRLTLATRQARGEGAPYVVAGRGVTTRFTLTEKAAAS